MKFELDPVIPARRRISSYGPGHVIVAGERHECNVVVTPERVITGWGPAVPEAIALEDMEVLAALAPEVVLVGTGTRLVFPSRVVMDALPRRGVGLEFMDTGAACRAYNFLLGEERRVIAALLLG